MICSIEDLQKYSNVYLDDGDTTQELYLGSAQNIVENYLGYKIEQKDYKRFYNGKGFVDLRLGVKNITTISKIEINGKEIDSDSIVIDDDSIVLKSGTFTEGRKNVYVEFTGGYAEVPEIMKLTVLRIATLLQLESDQNIGVSSRSFADNTRVFQNTTNYDKYLVQLSSYKLL